MYLRQRQQQLRRMAGSRALASAPPAFALLALGACALGWWYAAPPGWIFGAFFGLVAFAIAHALPHVLRAARALDAGRRADVIVMLEHSGDSESTEHLATVYAAPGMTWRFHFVPQGNMPAPGTMRVEARFASDANWPALLVFADGLAWPRSRPRRVENETRPPELRAAR